MAEYWFVTGGSGQVGTALRRNLPPGVQVFAPGSDQLDLANLPADLGPLLKGMRAIVNCGAYTAVDKAESEPGLAEAINAVAPGRLARAAAKANIPIIHVSTDYVFSGDGGGPWREDAQTGPLSVYGRTKLAGEAAVISSGARYAIVRTAWVVGTDGTNFVKTMLRLGAENDIVRVVADQRGTPTHAGDLSSVLAVITRRFIDDPVQPSGVWHCANAGETTWQGLAAHIFNCASMHGLRVPRDVRAIMTAEYPTAAPRPADSRLDCSRIATDFDLALRPWQAAIEEIVDTLARERKV